MAPIIEALSSRSDAELYALVDWLAHQPAHRDRADRVAATARGERLTQDPALLRSASRVRVPDAAQTGASLYNGACASCHGADGSGTPDGYYPSMFHNSAVGRRVPYNLLAVLLFGVDRHDGGQVMMPSFDGRRGSHGGLSDDQLAALANFVIRQFGNPAAAEITTPDIDTARSGSWIAGGTTAASGKLVAVGGGAQAAGGAGTACFRCHGFEGEGEATGGYPRLAGLDARYLVKQMQDYQSGARPNEMMSAVARQIDATEYQGTALYYAELSTRGGLPDQTTVPDSALIRRGATLYADGSPKRGIYACANCHGPDGRGLNRTYPSIVQPATYTSAQLRLWRSGVRHNDISDAMGRLSRPMSDDDISALSAFIAGLTP